MSNIITTFVNICYGPIGVYDDAGSLKYIRSNKRSSVKFFISFCSIISYPLKRGISYVCLNFDEAFLA